MNVQNGYEFLNIMSEHETNNNNNYVDGNYGELNIILPKIKLFFFCYLNLCHRTFKNKRHQTAIEC